MFQVQGLVDRSNLPVLDSDYCTNTGKWVYILRGTKFVALYTRSHILINWSVAKNTHSALGWNKLVDFTLAVHVVTKRHLRGPRC